jgi:hypothetical protein
LLRENRAECLQLPKKRVRDATSKIDILVKPHAANLH